MGKINLSKVILGGIIGGVAYFFAGYLVHMVLFKSASEAMMSSGMMKAASASTLVPAFILGAIISTLGTYTYALARPRLGASYASAFQVALLVGLLIGIFHGGSAMIWMANSDMSTMGFVAGLIMPAVGTFVGAWVYTE